MTITGPMNGGGGGAAFLKGMVPTFMIIGMAASGAGVDTVGTSGAETVGVTTSAMVLAVADTTSILPALRFGRTRTTRTEAFDFKIEVADRVGSIVFILYLCDCVKSLGILPNRLCTQAGVQMPTV